MFNSMQNSLKNGFSFCHVLVQLCKLESFEVRAPSVSNSCSHVRVAARVCLYVAYVFF